MNVTLSSVVSVRDQYFNIDPHWFKISMLILKFSIISKKLVSIFPQSFLLNIKILKLSMVYFEIFNLRFKSFIAVIYKRFCGVKRGIQNNKTYSSIKNECSCEVMCLG